jgi:hypothetical protein
MRDGSNTTTAKRDEVENANNASADAANDWAEAVANGADLFVNGFDDERGVPLAREVTAGYYDLAQGANITAGVVGDFNHRGGAEHLAERSRRFLEDLNNGLGAKLYEIIERIGQLEEDMDSIPDELVPGPVHHSRVRRRVRDLLEAGDAE